MSLPSQAQLDLDFPIRKQMTFLNHAAVGTIPAPTLQAAEHYYRDFHLNSSLHFFDWVKLISKCRELAAQLINASAEEIAFTSSTTEGLLTVARGFPWKKGDNIIIFEHEFPANVIHWKNLSKHGVEIRVVKEKEGLFDLKDIESVIDSNTKILSISFVEYSNGYRVPLEKIGELCNQKHVLFVVDAIQGIGAIPIDVKACHIDFLSAEAHKWLLSTKGIGIIYANPNAIDQLTDHNFGFFGVEKPEDFDNLNQPPAKGARRFENGSPNIPGIFLLKSSLEYLLNVGISTIWSEILRLTDYFMERLKSYPDFTLLSPVSTADERSGILSFYNGELSKTKALFDFLITKNVLLSYRRESIRIAPHFYNSRNDIDRIFELIDYFTKHN